MGTDSQPSIAPVLVVKRGRLGNFQFSFESDHGRLEGNVVVAAGEDQSPAEIEAMAHRKIQVLLQTFVTVVDEATVPSLGAFAP